MFNNKQRYAILSKAGYTGSTQEDEMEAFMQSKPSARSLVQKLERKAKEMLGTPIGERSGMAVGGAVKGAKIAAPEYSYIDPKAKGTTLEKVKGTAETAKTETVGKAAEAKGPTVPKAAQTTAATVASDVKKATKDLEAQRGTVSEDAQVEAAQEDESSVSRLQAEQGAAIMMDNPVQREIQTGELITGAAA